MKNIRIFYLNFFPFFFFFFYCKIFYIYYSKFAKYHFFDVRYFVHIITIYNQIATKGKSMFGPHKRINAVIDMTCTFCTRSMGRGLPVKIVDLWPFAFMYICT